MCKQLFKVYEDAEFSLYEYEPHLMRLYKFNLQNHSTVTKVRYLLDYFHKGKFAIYYLQYQGDIIGECMIKPGGGRFCFSKKSDIIIGGPYYIVPEHRGKGFSEVLIRLSLKHCKYKWDCAYDYIKKDNIASIRVTEKCGFKLVGEMNINRLTHTVQLVENNGRFLVYMLSHNEFDSVR